MGVGTELLERLPGQWARRCPHHISKIAARESVNQPPYRVICSWLERPEWRFLRNLWGDLPVLGGHQALRGAVRGPFSGAQAAFSLDEIFRRIARFACRTKSCPQRAFTAISELARYGGAVR